MMLPIQAYDAGAIGAVLALCQTVKMIVPDSWKKWLPCFALGFGVMYSMALRPGSGPWWTQLASGVVVGISAAGIFSATKNGLEAMKKKPKSQ